MNRGMARRILASALFCMVWVEDARASSNDEIVALSRAKVGDEAIVAQIANQPCQYQVELDDIVRLRKAGVSSAVVAAMIRRCESAASTVEDEGDGAAIRLKPGLYSIRHSGAVAERSIMVPAVVAAGRSGGNGSLLFPDRSKISLPGPRSSLVLAGTRPVFWIVTAPHQRSAPDDRSPPPGYEDLQLVRLESKAGKRQLQTSSSANGVIMSGLAPNRSTPIQVIRKSRALYIVSVKTDLEQGDYALLASDKGNAYRLYDFAIAP